LLRRLLKHASLTTICAANNVRQGFVPRATAQTAVPNTTTIRIRKRGHVPETEIRKMTKMSQLNFRKLWKTCWVFSRSEIRLVFVNSRRITAKVQANFKSIDFVADKLTFAMK
jgi:hypothetical protein